MNGDNDGPEPHPLLWWILFGAGLLTFIGWLVVYGPQYW